MDFFKTLANWMKDLDSNAFARFAVRLLMYSLLGWVFLGLNSFGIGDKTDQATQDALYKLAAPYYLSDAQKDIVIVLINQNSITELYQRKAIEANEWPIRYRDHAYLLSRILKYQPKSVFADIYFKQKRSTDDSFDQSVRLIDRLVKKYEIPLLFAGGYYNEEFTPVQKRVNELGELVLSGWQDYGQAYPLNDREHLSAAYRLYQLVCLGDSPLDSCQSPTIKNDAVKVGDAVSVRWGNRPGDVFFPEFSTQVCEDRSDSSWEVIIQLWGGLVEGLSDRGENDSANTKCAYHSVIYADELVYIDKAGTEKQKQRLAAALKNKVVMYALSLEGLHDNVYSPVHGQLPGVFFHAMALDNLMHYGADYVRASDDFSERINLLLWLVITLIFSGMLFRYEYKGIRFNDESQRPDDNIKPKCGLSVFWLSAFAAILIFGISLVMFLWVRYEPLNSIGFLVLIGASSWLVHSDFAGKVLRVISYPWRRGDDKQLEVISIIPFTHTSNPEQAEKFYKDIFDLELVMSCDWKKTYSADTDKNPRLSFASKGDLIPDLSIEVDDYDLALKRVKSAGHKIKYDDKKKDCELRQFYIHDPFGKLVSVFQYEKDIKKIRKKIRKILSKEAVKKISKRIQNYFK